METNYCTFSVPPLSFGYCCCFYSATVQEHKLCKAFYWHLKPLNSILKNTSICKKCVILIFKKCTKICENLSSNICCFLQITFDFLTCSDRVGKYLSLVWSFNSSERIYSQNCTNTPRWLKMFESEGCSFVSKSHYITRNFTSNGEFLGTTNTISISQTTAPVAKV